MATFRVRKFRCHLCQSIRRSSRQMLNYAFTRQLAYAGYLDEDLPIELV